MSEEKPKAKRKATSGTWPKGNGPGAGNWASGPAKGPGKRFNANTNAQGHNASTPISEGNKRAARTQQAEVLKDVLYDLAVSPAEPGSVRVSAANAFIDRVEGKPTQRQEIKLDVDPNELTDAELAALIRAEDDEDGFRH